MKPPLRSTAGLLSLLLCAACVVDHPPEGTPGDDSVSLPSAQNDARRGASSWLDDSPAIESIGLSPDQVEQLRVIERRSREHTVAARRVEQRAYRRLLLVMTHEEPDPGRLASARENFRSASTARHDAAVERLFQLRSAMSAQQWRALLEQSPQVVSVGPLSISAVAHLSTSDFDAEPSPDVGSHSAGSGHRD